MARNLILRMGGTALVLFLFLACSGNSKSPKRIHEYKCVDKELLLHINSLSSKKGTEYGEIRIHIDSMRLFSEIQSELYHKENWLSGDCYGIVTNAVIPFYLSGDKDNDLFVSTKKRLSPKLTRMPQQPLVSTEDGYSIFRTHEGDTTSLLIFNKIRFFRLNRDIQFVPLSSEPAIRNTNPYVSCDIQGKQLLQTAYKYDKDGNVIHSCKYLFDDTFPEVVLLPPLSDWDCGIKYEHASGTRQLAVYVYYDPRSNTSRVHLVGRGNPTELDKFGQFIKDNIDSGKIIPKIKKEYPTIALLYPYTSH